MRETKKGLRKVWDWPDTVVPPEPRRRLQFVLLVSPFSFRTVGNPSAFYHHQSKRTSSLRPF